MGCDPARWDAGARRPTLSVSSNGSNGLRPVPTSASVGKIAAFSILERIEWAATVADTLDQMDDTLFQYPRTDRMGCDTGRPSFPVAFCILSVSSNGSNGLRPIIGGLHQKHSVHLSVSSNGSNGLRPPNPLAASNSVSTFSILERIEWAATFACLPLLLFAAGFQYPRTDRMGCDPARWDAGARRPTLSVSSNGSNGLRPVPTSASVGKIAAFSILERIEWAATVADTLDQMDDTLFQYPRTDRMGCDTGRPSFPVAFCILSVSSNGSNGLRPVRGRARRRSSALSVSSNGSNGLRPRLPARADDGR